MNEGKSKINLSFLKDSSLVLLIIVNVITILLALAENWDLLTIIFIYWCQSIIICFFNVLKILSLKDFNKEDFTTGKRPGKPWEIKFFLIFIFLLIYSLFLFTFFWELILHPFYTSSKLDFLNIYIILSIIVFSFCYSFSFFYNQKNNVGKKQNINIFDVVMIIVGPLFNPMYLVICIGPIVSILFGLPQALLLLFLVLKTVIDVKMHNFVYKNQSFFHF